MTLHAKIKDLLAKLLAEGKAVLDTQFHASGNWAGPPPRYVNLQPFSAWRARCRLLVTLLGKVGKPWEADLTADWDNGLGSAMKTQGVLEAIQTSADDGLLIQAEELIWADAFANLSEQAEYLLEQNYFLASGVILRAVLEERLRSLCQQHSIAFSKAKPTLNDYNTELYKAQVYDKISFKEIDTLIAIGNDAAHNNHGFTSDKANRMKDGVNSILLKLTP
jgi:hypothetical protein